MLTKPPLNKHATTKPSASGTATPKQVIIIDGTPTDFICFISVPRPAENIMRLTPILAKKPIPPIDVSLSIV